ncbi:hypothetical protein [Lutibacter sp.]|uniref:Spy/CpxP family protein refolding chaperone n=1 Tax=Lutibacter sp. TaxID=1925666 RepID=UPI0025C54195|nr:hypothetical protein [Lutibacter sp.]MCF6167247.1 hypothetical protein [Lutibacter sp.]
MQKNTKILLGIITLLVLFNLTIIGTILFKKNITASYKEQDKKEIVIPTKHLGRFFRKELNLSFKQHRKFQNIRHQYHQDSDEIIKKMDSIRTQIIVELGKEKSDTIILNNLSKDLGNLHTELKNLSIRYYLNMKEVCNEKQKVKLFKIFKSMVNTEGNISMPKEKNYKNN